jgi:hypothetical protein
MRYLAIDRRLMASSPGTATFTSRTKLSERCLLCLTRDDAVLMFNTGPAHGEAARTFAFKGDCVKKARERCAVREMKVGPSKPLCRRRLQTAMSCFGQKPRW